MKSKSKFIIALVLFGVVTIGAIAGIIAVVASFNANVESNFKVSYTAQNVHATVSAGYMVSTTDSTKPQNLTYTPIKAGSAEQIEFNAGDEEEEVEKSFDGLTLDIKKNEYVYFKYTFTHTGDETNSMKFLNIALTKDFTQFENLTMEYGMVSVDGFMTSWNTEINELTAVRDEENVSGDSSVTDVYIRMYVTTKTKDAKLDGSLNWTLTGSEEYAYENAYIIEGLLPCASSVGLTNLTSVTFDYLDEDTESIVANAMAIIPVYADGSYGVNAYVVGTDVYVLSEYNIVAHNCWNMFAGISTNMGLTLNNFDTSKTTNMHEMFRDSSGLTNIDLSGLDTSKVTDMNNMFRGCTGLTNIDLTPLDTSNVTSMNYMFFGCTGLTEVNLTGLDMSSVTSVSYMFNGCTNLSTINLANAKMGTSMNYMFSGCTGLTSIDLTPLDTSNVTNMSSMFSGCTGLTSIDLSGLDTSNVTNMSSMFGSCTGLTNIDLTPLDTSNVTSMSNMFSYCTGLTSIDLSPLDTSNVTNMISMFYNCTGLTSIDLSSLDTSNVIDMEYMFYGCTGLTSIDLTPLDTSNVTYMRSMFYGCTKLVTIYADESFDTSDVTSSADMFTNCTSLVGGNGTVYDSTKKDKTYARIDKAGTPGYFTLKEEG